MGFYFYLTIIIGFSLLYYGYVKKKDNELKMKEIELEEKKVELEMKKLDQVKTNNFLWGNVVWPNKMFLYILILFTQNKGRYNIFKILIKKLGE